MKKNNQIEFIPSQLMVAITFVSVFVIGVFFSFSFATKGTFSATAGSSCGLCADGFTYMSSTNTCEKNKVCEDLFDAAPGTEGCYHYRQEGYICSANGMNVGNTGIVYNCTMAYNAETGIVNDSGTCVKGFKVTFDGNGGTPSVGYKICEGNSCSYTLPTATRSGYTFTYWNTKGADCPTGYMVSAGASGYATSAQTYYACWTANSSSSPSSSSSTSFPVVFYSNGGAVASTTYTCSSAPCSVTFPTWTRSEYNLTGWARGNAGNCNTGGSNFVQVGTPTSVSSATNFYACWTAKSSSSSSSAPSSSSSSSDQLSCSVSFTGCDDTLEQNETAVVKATVTVTKNGSTLNSVQAASYIKEHHWQYGGNGFGGGLSDTLFADSIITYHGSLSTLQVTAGGSVNQNIIVRDTVTLTNGETCYTSKSIKVVDCDECQPEVTYCNITYTMGQGVNGLSKTSEVVKTGTSVSLENMITSYVPYWGGEKFEKVSGIGTIDGYTLKDCDGNVTVKVSATTYSPPSGSSSSEPSSSSSSEPSSSSSSEPSSSSSSTPSSSSSSTPSSSSSSTPSSSSSSKPSTSVPSSSSVITENPKTGTVAIAIAWFIGITALVGSFYYFKKTYFMS